MGIAAVVAGGTSEADNIYARAGNDTVVGAQGHDVIYRGFGDDHLAGQKGPDRPLAGLGDDTVDGAGGEVSPEFDVLECGLGRDLALPGPGDRVMETCERVKRPER